MVKSSALSGVLVAIVLIALSVVVAHAGGGSGSGVPFILFDCYTIQNGVNSPYTLTVNDQFGVRNHVRLGKARLLCTQTQSTDLVDPVTGKVVPSVQNEGALVERGPELTAISTGDHLKCYDINPPAARAKSLVNIIDPFGGAAGETVSLEGLSVLCAPADKTVITP